MKPTKTWIIIDSNGLCWRSFHSYKDLSYDLLTTGVIFGFLLEMKNLAKRFSTKNFIFAWDSKKSIRKTLYPEYKAHRKHEKTEIEVHDENLAYKQFSDLRTSILPAMGFMQQHIITGYEADDIVADIVIKNKKGDGTKLIIASGDDDLLQLLRHCDMYNLRSKKVETELTFKEEYSINPEDWIYVKAIGGCTSDNIHGVPGVGEKTAIKYLTKKLPAHSAAAKKIMMNQSMILRNIKLIQLPLKQFNICIPEKQETINLDMFMSICQQYGFNSFLKRDELTNWTQLFSMQ